MAAWLPSLAAALLVIASLPAGAAPAPRHGTCLGSTVSFSGEPGPGCELP